MAVSELGDFVLVGGTALALQIGHRVSVDLDLFGQHSLDSNELAELLSQLGKIKLMSQSRNIIVLDINGVKVDFVNYKYSFIKKIKTIDGIRIASLPDIGAMKLAAISGRGRKRDFIDLFFMFEHYSIAELLGFYNQKFPDGSEFLVVKSLTYFNDADLDEDLTMMQPCSWDTVKKTIVQKVSFFV
jgi:predicted nucleotidyltransferase component of viral defense system